MTLTEDRPIFQQIAEQLEEAILSGAYPEESQVPSITEYSVQYRINPATALKGINLLVDAGLLYKKRGVGMFVASGAREKLRQSRRERFYQTTSSGWCGRPGIWASPTRRCWTCWKGDYRTMAIEFQHVTKRFGAVTAVEDVSVTFGGDKIYGLLGNNGAGKSTLLNILSGRVCPDSGTVTVDGSPVTGDEALGKLFLVGEQNLYLTTCG